MWKLVISLHMDELKIYRGEDFKISKYITLHQPTLGEICSFGEQEYYTMICIKKEPPIRFSSLTETVILLSVILCLTSKSDFIFH